jgi:hypothetical protein
MKIKLDGYREAYSGECTLFTLDEFTWQEKIIEVCNINAPFDVAMREFKAQGFKEVIPLWMEAMFREAEHPVYSRKTHVKDGILYMPDGTMYLLHEGMCLKRPRQAMLAHRLHAYQDKKSGIFTMTGNFSEKDLERAINSGLKIERADLDEKGNLHIPTKNMSTNKYGIFLFGNPDEQMRDGKNHRAGIHGDWLSGYPTKINEVIVGLDDLKTIQAIGEPYANQLDIFNVVKDQKFPNALNRLWQVEFGCFVRATGWGFLNLQGRNRAVRYK